MKAEIYKKDERLFIQLDGPFTIDGMDSFEPLYEPHLTPPLEAVFVNLAKAEYLDMAGLGSLLDLKIKSLKCRARFSLVEPAREVLDLLQVSRMEEVFEIVSGIDADRIVEDMVVPALRIERLDTAIAARAESMAVSSPSAAPVAPPPPPESPPTMQMPAEPAPAAAPQQDNKPPQEVRKAIEQYCRQAVEHLRKDQLDESVSCYLKAIELDPNYKPARNNLAIVYEKRPAWHSQSIEQWEILLQLSEAEGDQKHIDRAKKHLAKLRSN